VSTPECAPDSALVWVDGHHFVFMHRGREVWSCWPADTKDVDMLLELILPEKNWFTLDHRKQFVDLLEARFGAKYR